MGRFWVDKNQYQIPNETHADINYIHPFFGQVDVNFYLHLFQFEFDIIIYPPLSTLKRLNQ